jgi:hypothetical protein
MSATAGLDWKSRETSMLGLRALDQYRRGIQRQASQILEQNVRTFPLWISSVRGHRLSNIDLSVIKNTAITESVQVQFRGEALNAFNGPHFAAPEANPTSPNFGVVTGVLNYARRIQLGARVVF